MLLLIRAYPAIFLSLRLICSLLIGVPLRVPNIYPFVIPCWEQYSFKSLFTSFDTGILRRFPLLSTVMLLPFLLMSLRASTVKNLSSPKRIPVPARVCIIAQACTSGLSPAACACLPGCSAADNILSYSSELITPLRSVAVCCLIAFVVAMSAAPAHLRNLLRLTMRRLIVAVLTPSAFILSL